MSHTRVNGSRRDPTLFYGRVSVFDFQAAWKRYRTVRAVLSYLGVATDMHNLKNACAIAHYWRLPKKRWS